MNAPADDVVLAINNLNVSFSTPEGIVHAVRDMSYTLRRGEVMGIVGESGSGKSISCLAIMGLLPKNARVRGSIRYGETELVGANEKLLTKVRGNRIAMVFQDPMTSLNPVHRIGAQIAESVRAHDTTLSKRGANERAIDLLDVVGIPNARAAANNYPHEFSGGMRQRVVIAIAMANNPDIIIADEPTTALDVTVQSQILEALRRAQLETGAALVLVTHDLGVVAGNADHVLVMYAGKPVEVGAVDEIFYSPRMPYTMGLLASLPRFDRRAATGLLSIPGSPPSLLVETGGCPFEPRCPMSQTRCLSESPALLPTTSATHIAACHYSASLENTSPRAVYGELLGGSGSDRVSDEGGVG